MHVASEDNILDDTQTVLGANDPKFQIDPPTEFNTKLLVIFLSYRSIIYPVFHKIK